MKSLTYVELDLDYCALSYGVSPCTASGGPKCLNVPVSCQDRENYDSEPITLRFAKPTAYLPTDIDAIPDIISVQYTPATISLGETVGERASVKIVFNDHPHSDIGPGFDKYWDERGHDPRTVGTIWGRIAARHPYIRGQSLRLIRGNVGQTLAEMQTRHFVIDSVDGPTQDGQFTVVAKDTLKQLSGDRAQAPVLSGGSLSSNINSSTTSIPLTPAGIGDEEYPTTGYVNIGGKEIVRVTGRTSDTLTVVRGQYNTTGVAHDGGERCQICIEYSADDPADIIADLMENYAEIDSSFIPIDNWKLETESYYQRVNSALIVEPTPAVDLINELIDQVGLAIWWSDVDQEIKLQVLRAVSTSARVYSEDTNIIEGSLRIERQPNKRISHIWTYFGLNNPLEGIDDPNNFRSASRDVSDLAFEYGQPQIKRIFSRWIPYGGLTAADRVNDIKIGRFQVPPRKFMFKVARRDEEPAPALGEGCQISGGSTQGLIGDEELVPAQVTRVRPNEGDYDVEAEEMIFTEVGPPLSQRTISVDANTENFNLRDTHDLLYPAPVGGETVTVNVFQGAIVSSTSTSIPAFDVGDWPTEAATGDRNGTKTVTNLSIDATTELAVGMFAAGDGISGFTKVESITDADEVVLEDALTGTATGGALTFYTVIITANVNGVLAGRGADGPDGRSGDNASGVNGNPGGDALYLRYPINLNGEADADIQSGGGSGGGGPADYVGWFGPQVNGGGAGGGAGYGEGGNGGSGFGGANGGNGADGTLNSGGSGGNSSEYGTGPGAGGAGGNRGQSGSSSVGFSAGGPSGGSGGAAGRAVDGWSFVLEVSFSGNYYGSKVN